MSQRDPTICSINFLHSSMCLLYLDKKPKINGYNVQIVQSLSFLSSCLFSNNGIYWALFLQP